MMRTPGTNSMAVAFTLCSQADAFESDLACSPRQICPPSAKLSSTTPTRAPHSEAEIAAAIPAGPPPTTRTSNCFCRLDICSYFHPRLANDLATAAMSYSINLSTAFKADSHSTQRPARLARYRCATFSSRDQHGHCGSCSLRNYARCAVD